MYSALAGYVRGELFDVFEQNRRPLEDKWRRNEMTWKGEVTTYWKTHQEDDEDWKSKVSIDIGRQKAIGACSMIFSMAFKKGRLPFKLDVLDDQDSEKLESDIQANLMEEEISNGTMKSESPTQCRRGFLQAAIYGLSWYKMYTGDYRDTQWFPDLDGNFEAYERDRTFLGLERLSIWDVFWDLENDDHQASRGVIHRDYISSYDLREMKKNSFAVERAIECALSSYSTSTMDDVIDDSDRARRFGEIVVKNNTIEYLECWVRVPSVLVDEYERGECRGHFGSMNPYTESLNNGDEIYCLVGLVGNHIVRFSRLEKGARPFLMQPWDEDIDDLGPTGVMDRLEMYQNSLTGSFREFENNKKLSGNVLLGIKRKMMRDVDSNLKPGTTFDLTEDCERATDALQQIVIQDVGDGLLSEINLLFELADQASNLPRESMGVSGSGAASVTEYNQVIARSGKYLLNVITNFDQHVLEPYIEKYYEYLMTDPELSQIHGNYKVKAIGFESFEARAVKINQVMQMLTMTAQSPEIAQAMNIEWLLQELAKGNDIDPERIYKSKEQQQQEAQEAQQQAQEAQQAAMEAQRSDPMYQMELQERQAKIEESRAKIELDRMKVQVELKKLELEHLKVQSDPNLSISGGVQGLSEGGVVDPNRDTIVAENGPEFVNDELVTQPTIIPKGVGGQYVTSEEDTEDIIRDYADAAYNDGIQLEEDMKDIFDEAASDDIVNNIINQIGG